MKNILAFAFYLLQLEPEITLKKKLGSKFWENTSLENIPSFWEKFPLNLKKFTIIRKKNSLKLGKIFPNFIFLIFRKIHRTM